jgi:hypothetical protein
MHYPDLESNEIYQGIFYQAYAREAQDVLLRLGRKKLGEPSPRILSRIRALSDTDELDLLLDRYGRVRRWDQLLPTPEEKAHLDGVAASLLRLGRKKFGPPGERIEAAIAAIADLECLHELLDRILDVSSWDELLPSTDGST